MAWNQVLLRRFSDDKEIIDRLYTEVLLLRTLNNENIIAAFGSWIDLERMTLNFLTEFVFISGNVGDVKIGDLGLAAVVGKDRIAHSILGTPEFMAPDVYDENYTEMVDIYAFGMCVLELVTLEMPHSEWDSVVKIYKKLTSGVKP
ncbi:putative serine/threonine-protein kinase WNK11 [Morella rubra]|uniref:non-specific serine/threonine protein kinase n=1 Tax=Morella rubra TaxID=262757 RepID=A0A6A1WH53_9ROSI|nr:putative serine/threonine-protein kinase WNK11 [Morella rubra]